VLDMIWIKFVKKGKSNSSWWYQAKSILHYISVCITK